MFRPNIAIIRPNTEPYIIKEELVWKASKKYLEYRPIIVYAPWIGTDI
jgi:hypothetical protein